MSNLDEIFRIFGAPPAHGYRAGAWGEIEEYLGSRLPGDFKEFVDVYGPGLICGELVIFHPDGRTPLLSRMLRIHESFGRSRRVESGRYPFSFFPSPGGLISWGYDQSGDEHFFWPCDENPDRWKIVTNMNGIDPVVFDGSFGEFIVKFAQELRYLNPESELNDSDELVEFGEMPPFFEPIND
ncbi:SMI1/KNR4 family protein [Kitasatospora sp. NPDC058032]|uniref:SMI1/KNR4 family protein n=1 Tax=Kitasatospora sp. NPDC058032 TaxID=3346307 RepID=UPI0036DE775A